MVTDPVADLLTRIRNAQNALHKSVGAPYSKLCESVLKVLRDEGFIADFEIKQAPKTGKEFIVFIKYDQAGEPVIHRLCRVSTPGRRVYAGSKSLPKIASGLGIAVVSTSRGVMSDREARRQNLGGEVLASVW